MKILKKVGNFIRVFVEEYITIIAFLVMLTTMIYGVVMRYIFSNPLAWGMEVQSLCFVYIVFVGIGLAEHNGSTVEFEMIYNKFGKKGQTICRLIGNLLVTVFIAIIFIPSSKYLFSITNVTTVLRIPRNIVFTPFVIMLFSFILRHGFRVVEDIKALKNKTYERTYGIPPQEDKEDLMGGLPNIVEKENEK